MTLQLPRVKKGGIFPLRGDRWTADLLEVSDLQRPPNIVKPTSEGDGQSLGTDHAKGHR
jgi:hypothetical protein